MPYRKIEFINQEIYHVVARGVGNFSLFKENSDYWREIFSIYEFNTTSSVEIRDRRRARAKVKACGDPSSADSRDLLVEVLAFCFMPNHIHLLLKQIKDDGITQFVKKSNGGYAGYFREKYGWKGHLFQGPFRAVHIKDDIQLKTVFTYIHANPISLIEPKWKERGIKNSEKVIKFLKNYKWSSYQDYIGKKNFPSVSSREFLLKTVGGEKICQEFVEKWVKYKEGIKEFPEIVLDAEDGSPQVL